MTEFSKIILGLPRVEKKKNSILSLFLSNFDKIILFLTSFAFVGGFLYTGSYWSRFGIDPFKLLSLKDIITLPVYSFSTGMLSWFIVFSAFVIFLFSIYPYVISSKLIATLVSRLDVCSPNRSVRDLLAGGIVVIIIGFLIDEAILIFVYLYLIIVGGIVTISMCAVGVYSTLKSMIITFCITFVTFIGTYHMHSTGIRDAEKILLGKEFMYIRSVSMASDAIDPSRFHRIIGQLNDATYVWDPSLKCVREKSDVIESIGAYGIFHYHKPQEDKKQPTTLPAPGSSPGSLPVLPSPSQKNSRTGAGVRPLHP